MNKKIFFLILIILSIIVGVVIGFILSQYFPIFHQTSWGKPFDQFHIKIMPYYIVFFSIFLGISTSILIYLVEIINKKIYLKKALSFLKKEDKKKISNTIAKAEKGTSGEIRVHITGDKDIKDCLNEAKKWFYRLKMFKTRDRNGILLFIAPNAKKFAIYGDEGIDKVIEPDFWQKVKDDIENSFKQEKYVDGIINAVNSTGEVLKKFFPIKPDDKNELSNDVTVS
ncbi:MAG TPA: TPM domain-containing protein [Spirochaetota bacterium]|nr:TPM domain-containing protein [Spirochaetota bacterium]HOL58197.1 TPM domain-containing protein [Spirochaetota bacterium]HPP05646.1 TPM domain-containing protein [Spirochaetota bacterium]